MSRHATTAARLGRVKIFLCDVDGVMTDGTVFIGGRGEFKRFHVRDGMGLKLLQRAGIPVGWVSNRASAATSRRAKELGVEYLWQKKAPKVDAVATILNKAGLDWADACFVGDDVNDLAVLRRVGLAVAVANAVAEVRKVAHYVTQADGGQGAVREVCERILRAQRRWPEVVRKLTGEDV